MFDVSRLATNPSNFNYNQQAKDLPRRSNDQNENPEANSPGREQGRIKDLRVHINN